MADSDKDKNKDTEPQKPDQELDHKRKTERNFLIALVAVVAFIFIVIGAAFASRLVFRHEVAKNSFPMMQEGQGFRGGRMGFRGEMMAGDSISGTVTAVNGQQFTVSSNGTSKTVQISSSTRFPLNSATSVKVNDTVLVRGEQDSSGVIQATQINVNPSNQ